MDSARSALRVAPVIARVGREAHLELRFEQRCGRTVLAHSYVEPPFRIGRVLELDEAAYIIIVCLGAGVFAGDRLSQSVRVGAGARVVLASQAALQAHPADSAAPAIIDQRYLLDDEAELHCHWDPLIPFAGARLAQRIDLDVPPSARLSWSDAVMAGRVARGERWRFRELAHELRVRVDGALRYLERYRLDSERDANRAWTRDGHDYFGTSLAYDRCTPAGRAEELHRHLQALPGVRAAVDMPDSGLLLARFMAADGVRFAAARAAWRACLFETIFHSPRLTFRR